MKMLSSVIVTSVVGDLAAASLVQALSVAPWLRAVLQDVQLASHVETTIVEIATPIAMRTSLVVQRTTGSRKLTGRSLLFKLPLS